MTENEDKSKNSIEAIFHQIGSFGKFQKLTMLTMIFTACLPAINIYVTIFNAAEPELECRNIALNYTVKKEDLCSVWKNYTKSRETNEESDYECEFDKTYYGETIIKDWNLICDRQYLAGLTQTFFLIGTVCGLLSGYFGDRFGRKRSIVGFMVFISSIFLVFQVLELKYLNLGVNAQFVIYSICQFLIGVFSNCIYMSSYVLLLEMTSTKNHTFFSNIHLSLYVVGEILILIPSYFIRNWYIVNWLIVVYNFVGLILVIFFLEESPRLLISQKRFSEAEKVFKKIAKSNERELTIEINESLCEADDKTSDKKNTNIKETIKELVTPKKNFIKFLLLSLIWFALNLLYYGVSLGITTIDSVNPYLIYIFSSIAEIVGYIISNINIKIGPKKSTILFLVFSGIVCLVISFVPRNKEERAVVDAVVIILLASLGKCTVSAAFNICYVFTAEFYPTHMRNFAILFISCIGNIGSFISPQVNLSRVLWPPLPYIIFSCFALIGSVAVFFLQNFKHQNSIHPAQDNLKMAEVS